MFGLVPDRQIRNRLLRGFPLVAFLMLTLVNVGARAAGDVEHIRANDNRSPAGQFDRKQLQIDLEAREGLWFPESHEGPGVPVQAFAERGKPLLIPGPLIRVPEGTRVRATVRNTLDVKLSLHGFHTRPGDPSSVIEIAPGEARQLEFNAGASGTYFYWGSTMQGGPVTKLPIYRDAPLSGGFIVDPNHQSHARGDLRSLARHGTRKLLRRRARLGRRQQTHHAADSSRRIFRRAHDAAASGHVHVSHALARRASVDLGHVRAVDRARAGQELRPPNRADDSAQRRPVREAIHRATADQWK